MRGDVVGGGWWVGVGVGWGGRTIVVIVRC